MKKLEQEPNCSEIPTGSTTKNDLAHNLCDSCTNIGCEFQSGIVRTKCAFYMPQHTEPDNCGNYVVQDSTTKNNLSIYCDRSICLKNEYNNVGCEDCEVTKSQEPTTKNNLEVDCISRQAVIDLMMQKWGENFSGDDAMQESIDAIRVMPSVTPQEPILEKINKMKSEIADSLEFWDYSPNNNPLARDMLETLTNFWGYMREVNE